MIGTGLVVLLVAALVLPLSLQVINHSFERFEIRAGEQDAQQVELVLHSRMADLERTTFDYADWRAAAQFMRGEYPRFVEDNIADENLGSMQCDFTFVGDLHGNLVASRAVTRTLPGAAQADNLLRADETALAQQLLADPATRDLTGSNAGKRAMIVQGGDDWYAVGIASITDPAQADPKRPLGVLAFAGRIDPGRMARLRNLAGVDFRLAPATADQAAGVRVVGDQIVSERALVDTAGKPTGTLQMRYPRPLLSETRTTRYVLAATAIGAFVLGSGLLVWFVEKVLVRRLIRMDHDLGALRQGQISELQLSHNDDEVDRIGRSVNQYAGELTRARARWEHEAHHDGLTGLGNRVALLRAISLAAAEPGARQLWLLLLDLDGFKPINDNYGHATGDRVLVEVARRIERHLPDGAIAFRLGGDEFAVLAENVDEATMTALARALNHAIDDPTLGGGPSVRATASIGMGSVWLPHSGGNLASDLLQRADVAMYQVKRGDRNGMAVFDAQMQAGVLRLRDIERALRQALDRGQIEAFFQPIVEARQMRVLRLEALARWRRDGDWIMPDTFIAIAEQSGLMPQLDAQVLKVALAALPQVRRLVPQAAMAVNVSASSLLDPHYLEEVIRAVDEAGANDGSLVLELTESTLVSNESALSPALNTLQAFGIRVELDDFGVGYSSLGRLSQLDPFGIKLDGSFVRGWRNPGGDRICRAIVGMAKQLDIPVTAEFVEDARDAQFLREIGCHALQGYGVSPPLPLDRLLAWLRDGAIPAMSAAD